MAFDRRIVDKVGMFNPKVGRRGSGQKRRGLFKGAETDYFHRLAKAHGRIYYQPDAIVYHRVLPFQLTKKYFRTIHFNAGFQKAYFDDEPYARLFVGVPLFMYAQFVRSIGRYFSQLVTKGPDWAFRQQMTVGHFLGMLNGYIKSRAKKTT